MPLDLSFRLPNKYPDKLIYIYIYREREREREREKERERDLYI